MSRYLWAAIAELLLAALASAADYTVTSNLPGYTITNNLKAPCVCGDSCKCATGTCPGKCPVAASPPKGYPPAPAGYEWTPNPAGPDGWGLRQVGVAKSQPAPVPVVTTGQRVLTTADGRRYVYQCNNGQCVRVYLP